MTAIDQTVPVQGRDWAAVDRQIREALTSNFLKDRDDIQIAADDDVAYDDVVHVVDIATAAGLTDWTVTDPARLANR
jgi:biopolymer transport protein ExbD